jgi:hypothetical protein
MAGIRGGHVMTRGGGDTLCMQVKIDDSYS